MIDNQIQECMFKLISISCISRKSILPFNAPLSFHFSSLSLSTSLNPSFPLLLPLRYVVFVKHIYIKNFKLFLFPELNPHFLVYWPLTNFPHIQWVTVCWLWELWAICNKILHSVNVVFWVPDYGRFICLFVSKRAAVFWMMSTWGSLW